MLKNYFKHLVMRSQMIFLLVFLFSFEAYAFEGTVEECWHKGLPVGFAYQNQGIRVVVGKIEGAPIEKGEVICRYENGNIALQGFHEDWTMKGSYKMYHEDGSLMLEVLPDGSYNGPFIGTLKECEELGQLVSQKLKEKLS